MAQYIDKNKVVAEIERRLNYRVESLKAINDGTYWKEGQSEDEFNKSLTRCAFNAAKNELFELKCLLDTLEVKEVKEEPASEDLGEYTNELSKQFPEVSFAKLSRIAVRVAKWQKERMEKEMKDRAVIAASRTRTLPVIYNILLSKIMMYIIYNEPLE